MIDIAELEIGPGTKDGDAELRSKVNELVRALKELTTEKPKSRKPLTEV